MKAPVVLSSKRPILFANFPASGHNFRGNIDRD